MSSLSSGFEMWLLKQWQCLCSCRCVCVKSVMSPLALMVLRVFVCVCSRATWRGLLTLDSAAVWPEGVLPREQHRASGLAQLPGTLSPGFRLKCNSQPALISLNSLEHRGRCVCVCVVEERNWVLCYRASKCIYLCVLHMYTCGCVSMHTRQPHRSHCCDPAPGAGRQSRAPLTGGSTISHSSADGPVYSVTQRDRASKQETKKKIQR